MVAISAFCWSLSRMKSGVVSICSSKKARVDICLLFLQQFAKQALNNTPALLAQHSVHRGVSSRLACLSGVIRAFPGSSRGWFFQGRTGAVQPGAAAVVLRCGDGGRWTADGGPVRSGRYRGLHQEGPAPSPAAQSGAESRTARPLSPCVLRRADVWLCYR